jgi:hypothetical protein
LTATFARGVVAAYVLEDSLRRYQWVVTIYLELLRLQVKRRGHEVSENPETAELDVERIGDTANNRDEHGQTNEENRQGVKVY